MTIDEKRLRELADAVTYVLDNQNYDPFAMPVGLADHLGDLLQYVTRNAHAPKIEPCPVCGGSARQKMAYCGKVQCGSCAYANVSIDAHNQLSREHQAIENIKQLLKDSGFNPLPNDPQGVGFMRFHERVAAILREKGLLP